MAEKTLMTNNFWHKHKYTFYTGFFALGMVLALYFMLGVWPFGKNTVVTGDLGGIYINFYAHLKRFLQGDAGFFYAQSKGLGGNLTALFAYYYASPFNLIYFFFPLRWFPVAASIALMAKIVACCLAFSVYIANKFPAFGWFSVPLSLCYGFMAYCIAYAQNPMWHDGIIFLPLVCLGIERIVGGKAQTLYTLCLAASILANFYIAFMLCIFAVIYFLWAMLLGQNTFSKSQWAKAGLRFAGGSLIAGGLSFALLLPTLFNINQNKGSLLEYSFSLAPKFALKRLADRFLWGSFAQSDVFGELPFIYCGILALVLLFCFFAAKTVGKKEKLLSLAVLAVFVFSFVITGLDTAWHGLKAPIWFPARYSFIFCFFVLVLAGRVLAEGKIAKKQLIFAGGFLLLCFGCLFLFPVAISQKRIAFNMGLLVAYAILLAFGFLKIKTHQHNKKPFALSLKKRHIFGLLLSFFVAAELVLNAFFITRQFEQYPLKGFQQFADEAGGSISAIKLADENGGYRIAENYFRTLNDPMLLGYSGISHFASTQDGLAQSVLYSLGFRNYQGGGPYLYGGTAFADAVLGYKYLADSGQRAVPPHWQESQIKAPYRIFKNPYAMPMMFCVPTGKTASPKINYQEDMFTYQNQFAQTLGAQSGVFSQVDDVKLLAKNGDILQNQLYVPLESCFKITAKTSGWHYAYFAAKQFLLVPMLVNGNASLPYFSPEYSGAVNLGWLNAGETATLQFLHHQEIQLTNAQFMCLDDDALKNLANDANRNSGQISAEDGKFTAEITAKGTHLTLYTSIAYDENWRAKVNGEKVQPFALMGGLLALPLQEGPNQVELVFTPKGLYVGIAISAISLLAFCFLLFNGRKAKYRNKLSKSAQ